MQRLHPVAVGVDQAHHVPHVAQIVVGEGELHLSPKRLVNVERALGDADDAAGVFLQETVKEKDSSDGESSNV